MLDAMKATGYHVATVGEFDLKRGVNFVRDSAARGGFDLVSANIYAKGQGQVRPFAPYVIKKVGKKRYGIIGVIGKDDAAAGNRGGVIVDKRTLDDNQIVITDPLVAIKEVLPEVQKKSDLVVVIAHTGIQRAREIVQLIPEVDIVVPGHGGIALEKAEGTQPVLVPCTQRSDRLAILRLVSDGSKILETSGETLVLNQDKSPFNVAVRDVIWKVLDLDEKGNKRGKPADAPQTPEDSIKAALNAPPKEALPDQPENDLASRIEMEGDHYLGVNSCKDCHVSAWAQWSETKHAHAYESLASGDDWNNHECLPCHVTGYAQLGGHATIGLSPELWNVQCEECHGMGTLHTAKAAEVTEATCLRCHTKDQDPDFDFARDIVGMIH
ncbi:MAG: multiheme c-type cytochrome [bacterium]